MWIMMNDSFISIVKKPGSDLMVVRSRIAGDLEKVFDMPTSRVIKDGGTDYKFRAYVTPSRVAKVISDRIVDIEYGNFKDSVKDDDRHNVYSRIWSVMYAWQDRLYPSRWYKTYKYSNKVLNDRGHVLDHDDER